MIDSDISVRVQDNFLPSFDKWQIFLLQKHFKLDNNFHFKMKKADFIYRLTVIFTHKYNS